MEPNPFRSNKSLIVIILAFIAGALLSYAVFAIIANRSAVVVLPVEQDGGIGDTPQTDPMITPSQTSVDEDVFTSSSLGLSFNYLRYNYSFDENNPGIDHSTLVNPPRVSGNTISFGSNYNASMTMYSKQDNQSLETAIKTNFLTGIPATQCLPVRVVPETESAFYAPGNGISYVVLRSITPNGCPSQFDVNNPSAAFVSFSTQPNKFFYVVGGSDGMMPLLTAGGEPFWVTMKFNNTN